MNDSAAEGNVLGATMPYESEETATLGMGCFWSPEALFGHLPGVIRTRTGYAGGTTLNPTYRQMGDHTETVQVDFDPQRITYERLLDVFWNHHNPVNLRDYKGRQYMSLLLYHNERQRAVIEAVVARRTEQTGACEGTASSAAETEVAPLVVFYGAEERHQKYYVKRYPDAVRKLDALFSSHHEMTNSTLAARLNGLAKGYTNLERVVNEMEQWPIGVEEQKQLVALVRSIKW